MEKRIACIIRWLERCLEAHRAGELESALMDVECARADMDLLRDGFWSKLDRRRAARRRRARAAAFFETALGVALMILATATPLALPPENRRLESRRLESRHLESQHLKSQDEEIAAVPEPAIFAEEKAPAAVSEPETPPAQAVYVSVKRAGPISEPTQAQPLGREMNLSYENILALVQTGEKALKNEKPAIEIERRDRRGF